MFDLMINILDFLGRCRSHDKMQTERWRRFPRSLFCYPIKELQGKIMLVLGRCENEPSLLHRIQVNCW